MVSGFLPRLVRGGSSAPISEPVLSESSTRRRARLLELLFLNSEDGFMSGFVAGVVCTPGVGVSTLNVNCMRSIVPGFAF